MSTEYLKLTGPLEWAKLYPGQEDTKYGGKELSVNIYLDDENLSKFKASGSRIKIRTNENGDSFIKVSRDIEKLQPNSDKPFGYPIIINEDGTGPFDKVIGNGTIASVKLAVYDSKFGKGTRLEKVQIVKHVPFERGESPEDNPYTF